MLVPGDEVFTGCMFLIAETVVLLLAAGYAGTVVQTEYGVARPWHWPVTAWFGKKGVKVCIINFFSFFFWECVFNFLFFCEIDIGC